MSKDIDMLERIKSRSQRPTVQRDTSLTGQESQPTERASFPDIRPEPPEPEQPDTPLISPMDLEAQLERLPQVAPRRNIRLEESLDNAIQAFCNQENVTIETFLEACYLACDRDPELKQAILKETAERLQQRKEAGKLRRLHSQLQKMGQA